MIHYFLNQVVTRSQSSANSLYSLLVKFAQKHGAGDSNGRQCLFPMWNLWLVIMSLYWIKIHPGSKVEGMWPKLLHHLISSTSATWWTALAFLFSTKLRDMLHFLELFPGYICSKKWSHNFFSSYWMYISKLSKFDIR